MNITAKISASLYKPAPAACVFALLLCYVSLVPYPFIAGPSVAGLPVMRLVPLAAGLMLAPFAIAAARREGAPSVAAFAAPLLALLAVQMIGAVGSVEPVKSAGKTLFYFFTGAVFFFAAWGMGRYRERILWAFLVFAGIVGAVSVVEFAMGSVPLYAPQYAANNPYYAYGPLRGRSFSTLGHPVFLGAFYVLAAPVGFYLGGSAKSTRNKTFAAVLTALVLAGLFLTFSRGAYLAVVVAAVVFYRKRLGFRRLALALVLLAAVAASVAASSEKAREVFSGRNPYADYVQGFSQAHRVRAYVITAEMMGDAPLLGVGVGNYRSAYEKYRGGSGDDRATYATPDNMYLVTLAETGFAGFGLLLYLLVLFHKTLRRGAENGGALMPASLALLAGFAVEMLFFDALYVEPLRVVFWGLMGLACREASA